MNDAFKKLNQFCNLKSALQVVEALNERLERVATKAQMFEEIYSLFNE